MDFKAFSDENFDAVKWVNECFKGMENTNRETHASNIVYKLQLFVQEINSSLEETAQQVIHNLSKISREAESLQQETKSMKDEIVDIKRELVQLEQSSSQSMEALMSIDIVKGRMQESCKALREADNWTTLSADVEQIFSSSDFELIASKLIGMQNSLDMLMDVHDYQERVSRLEALKERFEQLITPQVTVTFSSGAFSESAHTFVRIFKQLKRMPSLVRLYSSCLKEQQLAEFKRLVSVESDDTLEWLNNFYDGLLSIWHSQSSFCLNVMFYGDNEAAINILTNLLIDILNSVNPSIVKCLEAEFERKKEENLKSSLDLLAEVKQITDRFAKSLELNILSNVNGEKFVQKPQVDIMASVLYFPYRDMLQWYPSVEKDILIQQHEKIKETLQLSESVSKIFVVAREAEKRCYLLTQSTALPSFVTALEHYFKTYLEYFSVCLNDIQSRCYGEESGALPNWSLFQHSLFHLQAIGDFTLQLELFEEQLMNTCLEISSKMKSGQNVFQKTHDLLLHQSMKEHLLDLLQRIEKDNRSVIILESSHLLCKQLCFEATALVLEVALQHVKMHLKDIQPMESMQKEGELPSFSLSPHEYITQIGQYLLTIPQHIEPFTLQENSAFKLALKYSMDWDSMQGNVENVAEFLLNSIAQKVVGLFVSRILNCHKIGSSFKQQLVTDIDYLCDVFDDLGLAPSSQLQDILTVLKKSDKENEKQVQDAALIRKMENLLE